MQGRKLDRQQLHQKLWEMASDSRQHLLEVHQGRLATELHITQATLCGAIQELTREGRIKKIQAKKDNVGVYLVREPQ